jgi:cytochrome c biogenesis protein CcmG, thiol:disulfide interchange protein DsbE
VTRYVVTAEANIVLKRIIPLVVVSFLVIAFTVAPALALLPMGQTAPDFQLYDLSNNARKLSDYRGKVVVFDFFSPYCGYCQQDAKNNLVPLYNTYYKNNANVQFLSIETSGASVSTIQSVYLAATGPIPWPILRNGGNVAAAYGIGVEPTVYVIDQAGKVALAMPYPINVATLKSTIDKLLGPVPTTPAPTTFDLAAPSQSVNPSTAVRLTGMLRTGATGLSGQPVELWVKSGTGSWSKVGRGTTGTGTSAGWVNWRVGATPQVAQTNQYYLMFQGTGAYAAAKSNVVTIKFENTKTTPYQTTLLAYAPKQVVAHGTTNTMWVKLMHGQTPLTGQYVYVWKWSGGKFVIVSRIITRTAAQSPGAGWAQADYRWNYVGTGMYKFVYYGTSPSGKTSYARSESNAVQLIWT